MSGPPPPRFDYDSIPVGHYDNVLRTGNPVRRLWHLAKFERVLDSLPSGQGQSLLDIGCFAGTFLSMVPEARFARQLGVDILPEQVAYAQVQYGTPFRSFRHVPNIDDLDALGEFDCITLIEVIEHLRTDEISVLFDRLARLLRPRGKLVVTTPNYASTWPLLELALNRLSDVSYEEQHLTKFTFFDLEKNLRSIYPDFSKNFRLEAKTTTHFMTPFLAALSFEGARKLSRVVPHRQWPHPFGNLVLSVFERK